jgi:hypothetical protein
MPFPTFETLATELRINIFEHLWLMHGRAALLSPVLVSKGWRETCVPILWRHMHITKANLAKAQRCLEIADEHTCSMILHISIHMESMPTMMLREEFPVVWPEPRYTQKSLKDQAELKVLVGVIDEKTHFVRWWDPKVRSVLLSLAKIAGTIHCKIRSLQTFLLHRDEATHVSREKWTEDYSNCKTFLLPASVICAFGQALPATCDEHYTMESFFSSRSYLRASFKSFSSEVETCTRVNGKEN